MQANFNNADVVVKAAIETNAVQVEKDIEKGAKKAGQSVQKITKGFDMAGVAAGKLGKLGGVLAGGWIAAAAAGIGLLIDQLTQLWDKITLTEEEALKKAEFLKGKAQKKLDESFANQKNSKEYINRLHEINRLDKISNTEKLQAISIIEQLSKNYIGLGLTVDEATGKIIGLDKAMQSIANQDQSSKQEQAKNILKYTARESIGLINQADGYKVNEIKGIPGINPHETPRQLLKGLVQKGDYDTALQVANQFFYNTTQDKYIEVYAKIITKLQDVIAKKRQYQKITEHGFRTDAENIKFLQEQNKELQKLSELSKKQLQKVSDDFNSKNRENAFSNLTSTASKQLWKQAEKSTINDELTKIESLRKIVESDLEANAKQYVATDDVAKRVMLSKERKDLQTQLNELYAKEIELKQQDNALQLTLNQLNNQAEKEKFNALKTEKERLDYLKQQLSIQQNLLKNNASDIVAQSKILDLQKQINDIETARKDIIDTNLKNRSEQLLTGLSSNDIAQRKRDFFKSLGIEDGVQISSEQYEQAKKLFDADNLKRQLDKIRIDLPDLSIKTNELTARGGFAGGAVMPSVERTEQAILSYSQRTSGLVAQIKNLLQNGGLI